MLFIDQLHNTISLTSSPKRIVSLVPSQSELLWDLGLREELVGITKFCIHPNEMFRKVTRIGGTKTVNIEMIKSLKPDLIIGNKEENDKFQILKLQEEFPVWMSDIYNVEDSLTMIQAMGDLVNKSEIANKIKQTIASSFLNLESRRKTVLYLIWKDPFMAAGNATFIGDLLNKIGLTNVLIDDASRYPNLSIQDMIVLNPELMFLSSEPYPFKAANIDELQAILPNTKIILVDGEPFSWYGSRLTESVKYFNQLMQHL